MKNLLFFLLFATTTVFSQVVEVDTAKLFNLERLSSIVADGSQKQFYFKVINARDGQSSSVDRYSFDGDHFVDRLNFDDATMNVYASEGLLYVTLLNSKQLRIYDYLNGDSITTIHKRYNVRYKNSKYLFVEYIPEFGNYKYYQTTGMIVLDAKTYKEVPGTFLKSTFIMGGANNTMVINKIIKWGFGDEYSTLLNYDCETLKIENFIIAKFNGVATSNFFSITPNGRFVVYSMDYSNKIFIYDLYNRKEYHSINQNEGTNLCRFSAINDNELIVSYRVIGGGYYYGIMNVDTTYYEKIEVDTGVTYDQFYNSKTNTLFLFSSQLKLRYKIKL